LGGVVHVRCWSGCCPHLYSKIKIIGSKEAAGLCWWASEALGYILA